MCGILCFINPRQKSLYQTIISGLEEIQNRGKDSCGIFCANSPEDWRVFKRFGTISNILQNTTLSSRLRNMEKSRVFLVQTRYITSQQKKYTRDIYDKLNQMIETENTNNMDFQSFYRETQPLVRKIDSKPLCIIHNGNIKIINKFIVETIPEFIGVSDYKTDTSLLTDFIESYLKKGVKMPLILKNIVENIDGAFNLIVYYGEMVYIVRDSLGMRPLSIAMKNQMICVSSESSLYNQIGFTFQREIRPGEIVICKPINESEYETMTYGVFRYRERTVDNISSCALEYVYLSNNNSVFNGILIKDARQNFGKQLWSEETEAFKRTVRDNKADYIVSYVPKTAYCAAEGYAKECGVSFRDILQVRRPGRTFIISNQEERISALHKKFIINVDNIASTREIQSGKRKKLILVDDSIVRGNTLFVIVEKLRATKLFSEIHIRSAAPPVHFEDYMGIDIPTKAELIANQIVTGNTNCSLDTKISEYFKVSSVRYLSVSGLISVLDYLDPEKMGNNWCVSWSNGDYPIDFEDVWSLYSRINSKNGNGFHNENRIFLNKV